MKQLDVPRSRARYPQLTTRDPPSQESSLFGDTPELDAELTRQVQRRTSVKPNAKAEAREFGRWANDKLDLLHFYLTVYRRVAGNGVYIDGFAGSGRTQIRGSEEPRHGSAIDAMKSEAFSRYFLYEEHRETFSQLERNLSYWIPLHEVRKARRRHGDFNELIAADLVPSRIKPDKPCFAFLDPNSTQLDWETVVRLASFKGGDQPGDYRIELLILFNSDQALRRLVPKRIGPGFFDSAEARTLDRVMGSRESWRDLLPGFRVTDLMHRYRERIEDLGYLRTTYHPIVDPISRQRQYFMIHASDHPKARPLMEWADKKAKAERDGTPLEEPTHLFD